MKYLLVDNGSLRPESVLNLRRIAAELSARESLDVFPASLLHSSKVPADQLGGQPAVNLERRLRWFLEEDIREFTVIPFFFGPTMAILEYLPQRVASLRKRFGDFNICRTPFLYDESGGDANDELVSILADNVRTCALQHGLRQPRVALVDHGSPVEAVTVVRNKLALRLQAQLGAAAACVEPASMERRPGDEYAFNEPLLERLLMMDGWRDAEVIICMLFLSPGRHAGSGGDIARICDQAGRNGPGMKTFMTSLVGTHPLVMDVLAKRLRGGRLPLE